MAGPQPRATAAPSTDTPDLPATGPLDLSGLERTGAVRFGRPVARVTVTYADGSRATFDLPGPARTAADLSYTQQRILEVLRGSDVPLSRKAVAIKLDRESTKGKFGEAVRDLVSRKLVYAWGDEITDDPTKFPATG